MPPGVFILGAGRAGSALAAGLKKSGIKIVGLHGRRTADGDDVSDHGLHVSTGSLPDSIATADVILVTVRDAQLDGAFDELLSAPLKKGATVLHASGSAEPRGVAELRGRGHPSGTFHPLVPLTADSAERDALRGSWIGVDGDDKARQSAAELARSLGASVMPIPEGEKASYHAAAVMASNFPCVLAYLAQQLLARSGVDSAQASAAVISLMNASVENLRGREPIHALTGPVVRGDSGTVHAHLHALANSGDNNVKEVYEALTHVAIEMVRLTGKNGPTLHEIEDALHAR